MTGLEVFLLALLLSVTGYVTNRSFILMPAMLFWFVAATTFMTEEAMWPGVACFGMMVYNLWAALDIMWQNREEKRRQE